MSLFDYQSLFSIQSGLSIDTNHPPINIISRLIDQLPVSHLTVKSHLFLYDNFDTCYDKFSGNFRLHVLFYTATWR